MRYFPEDGHDQKQLHKLNAEPWMVDLLKLNPDYVCWGPHEDYMCDKGGGWAAPSFIPSWKEFGWRLDELNECVNFYFEVVRPDRPCVVCGSTGLNTETKRISEDFYDHARRGTRWCDQITQDEVDALVEAGRLQKHSPETGKWESCPRTAAEVNAANRPGVNFDLNHDAINRWILVETRAKRSGVYGLCSVCDGQGSIYTEPVAHLQLVLWMIHPRKGCGRGVEIQRIEKTDLPAVFAFLRKAAERNAQRFAKIPGEEEDV